jgi:hypothetical protein
MQAATAAPASPTAGARARRIVREPRLMALLLAGGVMATVVVFVIGFSDAFYTTSSKDPANSFSAGTVQVSLSKQGELVDGSNLKPGVTRTGSVTVTNSEQKAKLTLGVSAITNTPSTKTLADVIRVTVRETSPSSVQRYDGLLKDLSNVALGTFAAGERRGYEIELNWPAADDDTARAGVRTGFEFEWTALSEP